MGRKCSVAECMSDEKRPEDIGVTFHKIPMHPVMRPKWMSVCRIPMDGFRKVFYVCSRHFRRVDFMSFKGKKYLLRQGVVPSIFKWLKSKPAEPSPPVVIDKEVKDTSESDLSEMTPNSVSEAPSVSSHDQITDIIDQKVKTISTPTGTVTFAVNAKIEARDFKQTWCPATIIEIDYQENELLVHFDKYSNKHDEWVSMNSTSIRAIKDEGNKFEVGERCLACWSDHRKFPGTVTRIMDKDTCEVQFDDGYFKVLKTRRMSKQSTTKRSKSDSTTKKLAKKRKMNDGFPKKRISKSGEKRSQSVHSIGSNMSIKAESTPMGEKCTVEFENEVRSSIKVQDQRLPDNWEKHFVKNETTGVWELYILNPEKIKFRDLKEILSHYGDIENVPKPLSRFDFTHQRQLNKPTHEDVNLIGQNISQLSSSGPLSGQSSSIDVIQSESTSTLCDNVNYNTDEESGPGLKILRIDDAFKCPIEGCGKNFRRENLAQMHIKHYHPEYVRFLDAVMPNVADLAYARTVGEPIEKLPGIENSITRYIQNRSSQSPSTHATPRSQATVDITNRRESESYKTGKNKTDEELSNDCNSSISEYIDSCDGQRLTGKFEGSGDLNRVGDYNEHSVHEFHSGNVKSNKYRQKRKRLSSSITSEIRQTDESQSSQELEAPARAPIACISNNNTIIEGGEVIKIVQMKQEEIINCTCGITEEDGLMIQCELCLCWQHAYCNNIFRENEVPEKYICYICLHPTRQRNSKKFIHDLDWLKHGTLPTATYHSQDEEHLQNKFQYLKRVHDFSGGLLEMRDFVQSLKLKIKISENKNHPKLYLWSKPWPTKPLPERAEPRVKSESEEKPNITASDATPAPMPEIAINNIDCRLNLLQHIAHNQRLVSERLTLISEQIMELESSAGNNADSVSDEVMKDTTQMLLRDLATLTELSHVNSL